MIDPQHTTSFPDQRAMVALFTALVASLRANPWGEPRSDLGSRGLFHGYMPENQLGTQEMSIFPREIIVK